MEPSTPPILKKLLAKRQLSSLDSYPPGPKKDTPSSPEGKNHFFHPMNPAESSQTQPKSDDSDLETDLTRQSSDCNIYEPPILKKNKKEDFGADPWIPTPFLFDNSPALTVTTNFTCRRDSLFECDHSDRIIIDEINLDEETPKFGNTNFNWKLDESIKKYIAACKGGIINENEPCTNQHPIIRIKCSLNHSWETTPEDLAKRNWCPKCMEKYIKCASFCSNKGIKFLNEIFLQELSFECPKGHIYQSNFKNYEKKTCSLCKKVAKEKYKQDLREEEEKIFKQREKAQSKLFEEAKKRTQKDDIFERNKEENLEIIDAYKKVSMELEELAGTYAKNYLSKKETKTDSDYDQALAIYRMLLMPEDVFKLYLLSLNSEHFKKEYRALAKKVHPDKNNHPKASMAFQKLNKIYEDVLKQSME